MASRGAMAARQGIATQRLQTAMGRLSEKYDVPLPPPNAYPYRQPELKAAALSERLAAFLEKMLGDDPAEYGHADRERTSPDDPSRATDGKVENKPDAFEPQGVEADHDGGTEDEPTFGGHPLSAFEGKSDEDVLAMDGVGEATLKKVKSAQRKAARRQQQ